MKKMRMHIELYPSASGLGFRWRIVSGSTIIARSRIYATRASCRLALNNVKGKFDLLEISEVK